jgi:FAD/FMN-containing dehydrogenase
MTASPTIDLPAGFPAEALRPDDPGYDAARSVFNAMIDRRPAVIVRCRSTADVVRGVALARERDLVLSVRGGGHNVSGNAVCDGGVMLDLSPMRGVRVDPAARTAVADPGCLLGDLDRATQEHGLATPLGVMSGTGIAGLTLGGGLGWLGGRFGLACDNLVAAEIVTASGDVLHVDADHHPDLLWGLRGGGGNFGIVTRFEFALHEVGPMVYAGPIFYPADADQDLLRLFREWSLGASEDITALMNLTSAPPLPVIPEAWHGRKVAAFIATSAGPVEEGEALVREFRAIAEPVADLLGPMPYHVIQTLIDPLWERGVHAYFKATNLARLDDGLIDRLVELHHAAPGPQCEIHVHQMGAAVAAVGDGATAFGERSMPYVLNAVTAWRDPDAAAAHIAWARAVIAAASEASTGRAYVNFLGDAGAARSAYGEETYSRLVELKSTYDPHNVFARNQNIEPYPSGNGSAAR